MANKIMMMYDKANGDQAISDSNGEVVVYPEDIKQEVLEEVVTMWNTGKTLKEVVRYIDNLGSDKESGITEDEAEYLIEQIEAWNRLSGAIVGNSENVIVSAPVEVETNQVSPGVTEVKMQVPVSADGQKVRTTRGAKVPVTGKVNAKSLVEKLKEQIALIEWIDGTMTITELPTPLSKDAREVLITLQKEVESSKQKAIMSIQEL